MTTTSLFGSDAPPKQRNAPVKSLHQQFIRLWVECWKNKYHADYPFAPPDARYAKQILDALGRNLDKAAAVVKMFLACADQWLTERRHALRYLANNLPRYIPVPKVRTPTVVIYQ